MLGGVTAAQLRLIALEEDAVAVSPVGADGSVVQLPPVTVSVAELLVIDPPALVTTTVKTEPLSVAAAAGVV